MKSQEIFNADYLNYIITNFEEFKEHMRWWEQKDYNPLSICKKYLHRSRNGKIVVDYKQKEGKGRFCSIGSMSLQNIPREVRHTISKEYYVDIDMSNAHPIILSWLCKKNGFKCDELDNYILNRENLLKKIKKDNKSIDREQGKKLYLSLTNGGNKDFNDIKTPTDELLRYKHEMMTLHRNFSRLNNEEFEKVKERRKKQNKDYNHEASYMNTLLCDMENTLLMEMWEYFKSPENCVFCFDGIMLRNNIEYDVEGCIKYIRDKYDMPLFDLKIKPMEEGFDMSNKKIKKHTNYRLQYYTDFKNLVKEKEVYEEWVEEWINNSLKLIENDGNIYYITRNRREIVFSDKTKEIRDEWKPVKTEYIEKSLKVKCKIINPYYDYDFHIKFKNMKPKEQKNLSLSKEEINKRTKKNIYETLGVFNIRLGEGYLSYLMENRVIDSYNKTDFYPLLQRLNNIEQEDSFNIFTQFPFENDIEYNKIDFEKSLLYTHLKNDFFNNEDGELKHFLDHIADLIQDPAQIKGTSHLFYSPQGCGKGLLFKFMSKLLGVSNIISIINTDTYFDKNFNSDISNKLLKVFEEVSEKGSAFKNHNRLKGEQTSDSERIEPKGIDAYYNRHCARFWYFTNNENSLYIENDDRRHTLHRISNKHQNNYEYFKPIWEEIANTDFLKSAFEYFCNRKYEDKNVRNAYTTQYKKEQKDANLSNGIKFLLNFVNKKFKKIEDKNIKITSSQLKDEYKRYCENRGCKYHINTLMTQIRKIGIEKPTQVRVNNTKKFCYKLNTYKLQEEMKRFLQDEDYKLLSNEKIEEVNEEDILDYENDDMNSFYDSD